MRRTTLLLWWVLFVPAVAQAGTLEECTDRLSSHSVEEVIEAANCLGELGPAAESAIPGLIELLSHPHHIPYPLAPPGQPVQYAAAEALTAIGRPAIGPLLEVAVEGGRIDMMVLACDHCRTPPWGLALGALVEMGEGAVSDLLDALDSDRAAVRALSALALDAHTEKAHVLRALLKASRDEDPAVRRAVVHGLESFAQRHRNETGHDVIRVLLAALEGGIEHAGWGLARVGEPAAKPVAALVSHPEAAVRKLAVETLDRMRWLSRDDGLALLSRSDVIRALIEALSDPDREVRYEAKWALSAAAETGGDLPELRKALTACEESRARDAARSCRAALKKMAPSDGADGARLTSATGSRP